MLSELLLPDPSYLRLDSWEVQDGELVVRASTTKLEVQCPYCESWSKEVHSYYTRKPADVACASYQMRMQLSVRRFYCRNRACSHTTFAERIPSVVAPYARRTARLTQDQTYVAFVVGGEEGARLLALLRMPTSPDTLLRLVRRAPEPIVTSPRVLGVDDWSFRRGVTYGTILVDLESHQTIDLLPERSAESLARWLQEHPGIEIISRDRGNDYIKGATLGAPTARQVADRWHILKNLREAVERYLGQKPACLKAAVAMPDRGENGGNVNAVDETESEETTKQMAAQRDRLARRQLRQQRYDLVKRLHAGGASLREISRQLGMSFHTVSKYVRADSCPFYPKGRSRPSLLDPFMDYLHAQWQAGRRNASQLWREIRSQGFTGSRGLVGQWAAAERKAKGPQTERRIRQPLTPGQAVWLFMKAEDTLSNEEQAALKRMADTEPQIPTVRGFVQDFIDMIRRRRHRALVPWLKSVSASGIAALKRFVNGIQNDLSAVKGAFELPWSQAQVEGQVNRLKLIKRSMYGRARFDLLRKRVLGCPALHSA